LSVKSKKKTKYGKFCNPPISFISTNSHNFTEISLCLDLITGLGLLKSQTTFLNNNPKATATGEGKELF